MSFVFTLIVYFVFSSFILCFYFNHKFCFLLIYRQHFSPFSFPLFHPIDILGLNLNYILCFYLLQHLFLPLSFPLFSLYLCLSFVFTSFIFTLGNGYPFFYAFISFVFSVISLIFSFYGRYLSFISISPSFILILVSYTRKLFTDEMFRRCPKCFFETRVGQESSGGDKFTR